jgi:NAD(P)-dependent dehydrogenase (short-subunit alcohol dehydrogenase family)
MSDVLKGKVIIVTGAGRGVGAEIAKLAAKEGAKVVVNDLGGSEGGEGKDLGPAQQVVAELKAAGGDANKLFADALNAFGDVDAVINYAGILWPRARRIACDSPDRKKSPD